MKNVLLLAAFIASVYSSPAQSRIVLYEEFTSETCAPSRIVDSNLWTVLKAGTNLANIQLITFITPYPSQGNLFKSNPTEYTARSSYYGIPFVSNGRIDGTTHDTSSTYLGFPPHHTQPVLDQAMSIPARFELAPTCRLSPSGDSLIIDISVTSLVYFAPPGGRLKLYTALIRTLDYATPPGSNGQTHFENMVRKMYPSPSGTLIDSTWEAGDIRNFRVPGVFPFEAADSALHPHTSSPGILVVWLQNDNDKVVEQCARAVPLPAATMASAQTGQTLAPRVYPSPAKDHLNISFASPVHNPVGLLITDMLGRIALQKALNCDNETLKIDLGNLSPGWYTLLIESSGARHETIFRKD